METLLRVDAFSRGDRVFPDLERYSRMNQMYLDKAIRFYRGKADGIHSEHVLTKIVNGFYFSITMTDHEVYAWAREHQSQIAGINGITSVIQERLPHESIFYDDCDDYLVTYNQLTPMDLYKSPGEIMDNFAAVIPLYHPYVLPLQYVPSGGSGRTNYSVIGIDIPAIAIQYKYWLIRNGELPLNERLGPGHFVGMVLLPNMLKRQADISRLNMALDCLGYSRKFAEHKTAIDIIDNRNYVYKEQKEAIDILIADNKRYTHSLTQLITNQLEPFTTLISNIQEIDVKQTYRASFLAALPLVWLAATVSKLHPNLGEYSNDVRRVIRTLRYRQTISLMPSKPYKDEVKQRFNEIKEIFDVK